MKCVLLLGPPCSGKSAVGREVANRLRCEYISSGDIARQIAAIDQVYLHDIKHGKMAPEDAMRYHIRMAIRKATEAGETVIILDGFPRFDDQYHWLLSCFCMQIVSVLMNVSDEIAVQRANKRNREDDISINERLAYYHRNTEPMINLMTTVHAVNVIDGNLDKESAIDQMYKIINRRDKYAEYS